MLKVLNHKILHKDMEMDWTVEFSCYGLNLSTMQFENVSYLTKNTLIALNIFNNSADYSEEIAEEAKHFDADYILYTQDHWAVGYVVIGYNEEGE